MSEADMIEDEESVLLDLPDDGDALDKAFDEEMAKLDNESDDNDNDSADDNDSDDADTKEEKDKKSVDDEDKDDSSDNDDDDSADSDNSTDNSEDSDDSDDTTDVIDKLDKDAVDKKASESKDSSGTIDYKAEFEKLTKPFKANGKQIQIDNVEDAISLMQMGANYVKKMESLKPNLKIVKMLAKNDLLDESKISYLIDLNNKNPGAISKLVKDSKIDPLDFDSDKEVDYSPSDHKVTDNEVELDSVLDSISDSESYNRTTDILGNKWDDASKAEILKNPNLIRIINSHIETGVYDQVANVVANQRMLGKIPSNVSDVEAYGQTARMMNEQGLLVGSNTDDSRKSEENDTGKMEADKKRSDKRKAAGATKKSSGKSKPKMDILNLSDEDFAKVDSAALFKTV